MNLKGVWFFNKNLTGDYEGKESISFSFPENPTVQEGISLLFTSGGIEVLFRGSASAAVVYSPSYGWYGDFYRCMDFGTEGANVGDSFYSYILANAAPLIPVDHPEGKLLLTQDRICESNITVRLQMQDRTLTANGEYFPDEGKAGMEKVKVALSFVPLSVTKNGTYLPEGGASGFSQVQVDVERKTDFEIIGSMAYRTEAPENALPVAELLSFGGMTQTAENRFFAGRVSRIFSAPRITSWSQVQTVVRSGLARNFFQIGDQLVCNKGDKPLVWDIIGFDHDTPADPQYTHSLTLQTHHVVTELQWAGAALLFYANPDIYPDGLAAGTYNVILDHGAYSNGTAEDGSYQFTLTQAVPAGGGIRHTTMGGRRGYYGQQYVLAGTFTSYDAGGNTIETELGTSLGSGGTNLGSFSGCDPAYISDPSCCNFTERNYTGSNRWKHAAVRQYLNSDKPAGSVWEKQHVFDLAPGWVNTDAGFLSDMDADFLEVIGDVSKRTALSLADGGGYEDLTEKFFLISRSEAYAQNEGGINEGAPYEYYSQFSESETAHGGADSIRIKNNGATDRYWWTRTHTVNTGYSNRIFSPTGFLTDTYQPGRSYGVAPACCIV